MKEEDQPRWGQLCVDSYPRLNSYARRLTNGNADAAQDLVQETVYRALKYSMSLEDIQNPLSYLLGMMHNAWVDKAKKDGKAHFESIEDLKISQHPTIEPDVYRHLENREYQNAMDNGHGPLTEREELLLKLRLEGYKAKEIAARLNEDVRLTRTDLNAVNAKVRYRLRRQKTKKASA